MLWLVVIFTLGAFVSINAFQTQFSSSSRLHNAHSGLRRLRSTANKAANGDGTHQIVLVRHGESVWNQVNS